ncbi:MULTISPECIES: hypothetical protein [Cyanophyceae]|uniref:Uncharacterized protein n=1 Tax=Leptolyngbya subtilissima DQ-A4 TaxID=2933933 RepID=A0ABV0KAC5_9CYAN|nr:hypothetical protein [Nodosilinea sp. FACHB-141]MBD2115234.1 hypothetical protein [Nodosilinea sp. FACHB-141]
MVSKPELRNNGQVVPSQIITMITKGSTQPDDPRKYLGPLHQQAVDVSKTSTGDCSELEKLEALVLQATDEKKAEMLGGEIER